MKLRLILETKSPRKKQRLTFKIPIPPSKFLGINNFVKAALKGKQEVTIQVEVAQPGEPPRKGPTGYFRFMPLEGLPDIAAGSRTAGKEAVFDPPAGASLKICFSTLSPKKQKPISIKLKIPGRKRRGFISFVDMARRTGGDVFVALESDVEGKRQLSKIGGIFRFQEQ